MRESISDKGKPTCEDFINEAATAVRLMTNAADLDQRIGILRDRVGVADERLATFIVTVPDTVQPDEINDFRKLIADVLAHAVKGATAELAYRRTWNVTEDAA